MKCQGRKNDILYVEILYPMLQDFGKHNAIRGSVQWSLYPAFNTTTPPRPLVTSNVPSHNYAYTDYWSLQETNYKLQSK